MKKLKNKEFAKWLLQFSDNEDYIAYNDLIENYNSELLMELKITKKINESNFIEAQSLLDTRPYDNEEVVAYKDYTQININLKSSNRSIFEMTVSEKATMLSIANSKTKTSFKAQNVLYATDGIEFEIPLPLIPYFDDHLSENETTVFRTSNQFNFQNANQIYPNPINVGENLNINLTELSEVRIFDTNGKTIFNKNTNADITTLNINTSFWEQGVYLIKIRDTEKNTSKTKKLIIQ